MAFMLFSARRQESELQLKKLFLGYILLYVIKSNKEERSCPGFCSLYLVNVLYLNQTFFLQKKLCVFKTGLLNFYILLKLIIFSFHLSSDLVPSTQRKSQAQLRSLENLFVTAWTPLQKAKPKMSTCRKKMKGF